jgi:hypothetical protein
MFFDILQTISLPKEVRFFGTSLDTVPLDELMVAYLVFSEFCGTRWFIAVFRSARYCSLS